MRLTIGPARAKVVSFNNNQTRGSWVMKRVGILVGREKTFPDELIKRVNERGGGEVIAEFIKLGGVRHDAPPRYDVVVARISHEVPFYRATLKRMALEGATIIKPCDGGGWKNVSRVNSLEELIAEYDETGTLCMTVQEFIDFDQFLRCYCIGQEEVMIMPY